MDDNDAEAKCLPLRAQYEESQEPDSDLSEETRLEVLHHFAHCLDCKIWHQQITAIEMAALTMPQFDVPEAIVQKVLAAVDNERHRAVAPRDAVLLIASIAAFIGVLIAMPIDSLDGAASWGIGFVILAGMNFLKHGAISSRRTSVG